MEPGCCEEKSAERAYWRSKLPAAFRFFLEMLTRELLLNEPCNRFAHAAGFFEELLIQRDMELCLLPDRPYLCKLKAARGIESRSAAAAKSPCCKCSHCGKAMRSHPSKPPTPEPKKVEPCSRCACCGRMIKPRGGGGGAGGQRGQTDLDGDVRVNARPFSKDAWGRMMSRKESNGGELVNCRSLSILVDY